MNRGDLLAVLLDVHNLTDPPAGTPMPETWELRSKVRSAIHELRAAGHLDADLGSVSPLEIEFEALKRDREVLCKRLNDLGVGIQIGLGGHIKATTLSDSERKVALAGSSAADIIEHMRTMTEDDRLQALNAIVGGFCTGCGRAQPEGRACQCENDE